MELGNESLRNRRKQTRDHIKKPEARRTAVITISPITVGAISATVCTPRFAPARKILENGRPFAAPYPTIRIQEKEDKIDRYITICMSPLPLPLFPLIYAAFALFMRGMDML